MDLGGESDAIRFESVSVLLGGFPALLNASLRVSHGELIYLRGPNGAGKTTLLRTLAGLTKVSRGHAWVSGLALPGAERALRDVVGLVGSKSHLYEDLTVHENLEFVRSILGLSHDRTAASQEVFGLAGRLQRQRVSSLSAGQKKRVALCALLMKNPRIWLLDEPHSSLDQQGRRLLDDILVQATSRGAVAVVASHESHMAGDVGARVLELVAGKVVDAERRPYLPPFNTASATESPGGAVS